jgi:hypothetical protein
MSPFLRRYSGPLLLFLGGAALIAVAPCVVRDRSDTTPPSTPPPDYSKLYGAGSTRPGIRQPPVVSAAASGLTESDEVIGVVVHGKARAYSVQAMSGPPQNHVINDLVGGTPVTVTYNPLGQVIRVFTGPGSEPLGVDLVMTSGGEMTLDIGGGRRFVQRSATPVDSATSGQFPFDSVPHELTVWKKWRDAHPDTDAVVSVTPPKS